MREIKFRGWNGEKMDYHALGAKVNLAFTEFGIDFPACYSPYWSTRNHTSLMQFTGLYDVNGKEIYEGDILQDHSLYPLPVVWDKESTGFVRKDYDDDFYITQNCEVIGNIYENPELLGVTP